MLPRSQSRALAGLGHEQGRGSALHPRGRAETVDGPQERGRVPEEEGRRKHGASGGRARLRRLALGATSSTD